MKDMPVDIVRPTLDETLHIAGRVRLLTLDLDGHLLDEREWRNVITTAGKQAILHLLGNDGAVTVGAQYLAVGTGAGTPAASDTALFSELARNPITQATVSSGNLLLQTYFTSLQANGSWTEAGLFGAGASGIINSGTLFGHVALTYNKTNTIQTILQYTVSLT